MTTSLTHRAIDFLNSIIFGVLRDFEYLIRTKRISFYDFTGYPLRKYFILIGVIVGFLNIYFKTHDIFSSNLFGVIFGFIGWILFLIYALFSQDYDFDCKGYEVWGKHTPSGKYFSFFR